MKVKRLLSVILALVAVFSLCLTAFAASGLLEPVSGCVESGDNCVTVHAKGPGIYDLGNGKTLAIEPITEDESSDDELCAPAPCAFDEMPYMDSEPDDSAIIVHVNGIGEYDLGNGMTLTIEPISEENTSEPDIEPYLNVESDNMALTTDWSWYCDDEPLLTTNLKIYNKKRNPGNLHAHVRQLPMDPYAQGDIYIYDIEPGTVGRIDSISALRYTVELSASVRGYYDVRVTDWP